MRHTHTHRQSRPTNIGITRGTLSVGILVLVSNGVNIWVALRFFLIKILEQPITKFTLTILVGQTKERFFSCPPPPLPAQSAHTPTHDDIDSHAN